MHGATGPNKPGRVGIMATITALGTSSARRGGLHPRRRRACVGVCVCSASLRLLCVCSASALHPARPGAQRLASAPCEPRQSPSRGREKDVIVLLHARGRRARMRSGAAAAGLCVCMCSARVYGEGDVDRQSSRDTRPSWPSVSSHCGRKASSPTAPRLVASQYGRHSVAPKASSWLLNGGMPWRAAP